MFLVSKELSGRLPNYYEGNVRFLTFVGTLKELKHSGADYWWLTVDIGTQNYIPEMWEIKTFNVIINGREDLNATTCESSVSYSEDGKSQFVVLKVWRNKDEN